MSVTGDEWVETCVRLERDYQRWVRAGRPSVDRRYSGVVAWAMGFSWKEWYEQAVGWFLQVYPVFVEGVGRSIRPPDYTPEEIQNAQEALFLGVLAARRLDEIGGEGLEEQFGAMFETMCEEQGGRLI